MRKGFPEHFALHYQLQVNAHGEPVGVEALIRWHHPTLGNISPAMFIPLAEETDFVIQMGTWVLETACRQLVAWSEHPTTQALTIAVNVSAKQFHRSDFVQTVVDVIQQTGAKPNQIKLELTEGLMLHDVSDVIEKMHVLRRAGVHFSIDDFGTGYSSLSYLKRLPLDQLKIDRSFVHDLQVDPNDQTIARTVVTLGHSLGLNVIAEGVETTQQRDILLQLGCDSFQGYLYGRPMGIAQLMQTSAFALPRNAVADQP
jgi:EAL domain-containing protein (putative c-di-GMP-specific phosphodiesterase class I)